MSPRSHAAPASPAALRALNRLAVSVGSVVQGERRRRRWPLRVLAERAGVSIGHLCELEGGLPVSLETYARVLTALDLPVELAADRPAQASGRRGQDFVHAAMGEVEARRLRPFGFELAIDEPYQHYQFAGRADLVAWNRAERALLHIENRTRFPNVQEALGSFGSKRAYLGGVMAERVGLDGRRWASETHVIAGLWSSEVLHVLRQREATFRTTCPDPPDAFDRWWVGDVSGLPRTSSCFVLMDPVESVRDAFRFAPLDRLAARPRYRDYADAAERLRQKR